MEPWEDELLWDDDFSDEEEDTEEQIEEADLEMDEDSFADWEDASDVPGRRREDLHSECCTHATAFLIRRRIRTTYFYLPWQTAPCGIRPHFL